MVVVVTLAHRGAHVLQRAFVPIVLFAVIFGRGGLGPLSHKVPAFEREASAHGGAPQFGGGTGDKFEVLGSNNTSMGRMGSDGTAMGDVVYEFPNAFFGISSSRLAFPMVFDVMSHDPQFFLNFF